MFAHIQVKHFQLVKFTASKHIVLRGKDPLYRTQTPFDGSYPGHLFYVVRGDARSKSEKNKSTYTSKLRDNSTFPNVFNTTEQGSEVCG